MSNSAIEIINSRFGIFYAVLNSSMNLTFTESNLHNYLGLKKSEDNEVLTDLFPELFGLETEVADVICKRKDHFCLNTINRTVNTEIFFNLHIFSDPENDNTALVIVEDITQGSLSLRMVQQKRNEMILKNNELIRREEFVVTLLNTIPDPVFYKDSSGRYIGCNREFELFTGFSRDELSGKSSQALFSDNNEDSYDRHDRELISNGGSIHYETEIINNSGEKFYVIINKSVFPDSDYGGAVIVGVITDITGRKKMEEQLKDTTNMLEISRSDLRDQVCIMERNLLIARNAVDALLQKDFPETELFDISCRYLPLAQIGGDFYSVIKNGGSINIFICDISGHGVAAALFLSLIKYFSESIINEYGDNPVRYLEELNHIYLSRIIPSYYFTAIAGRISFDDGIKFTFSNGGHPHPILMKRNGEIKLLGDNGMVVGIFENQKFSEFSSAIESGDMLFLYTDGIPETQNQADSIIGFDKSLLVFFSEGRRDTLEETMDAIIKQLIDFRGDVKQKDDILLLGFLAR
jgi:PAS domain S-box-containing protein